jgi:F-type H+-transporting ATPase subunit gamma
MPESLVNTKRRIATIRSTKKITKAMKLVASVKYQRWKKMYDENLPYYSNMKEVMQETLSGIDFSDVSLPYLLQGNHTDKVLYVIVSSSLGLCGAYNYNLFKMIDPLIHEQDELFLIGQKALTHYQNSGNKIYDDYVTLMDQYTYSAVRRMRHQILRLYKTGKYSKVVLVYTEYKNSLTFTPICHTLVPIEVDKDYKESLNGPLFEPKGEDVLDEVLPHYIDSSLYRKLMESEISELSSRRNAMETATDSADKIQSQLQLEYNKARQNAITQEITEVVGGANAGKEKED